MSKQCQLTLKDPDTVELLRNLFKRIQVLQHPCLQVIYDISYKADYVGILQSYYPKGSIRDHLFKVKSLCESTRCYRFYFQASCHGIIMLFIFSDITGSH